MIDPHKNMNPYDHWLDHIKKGQKQLAVLVDPDKCNPEHVPELLSHLPAETTHIFVGGSTVAPGQTDALISVIKSQANIAVWLFPGDEEQITPHADALLFLSLVSGDNPEYLIRQQVRAAAKLRNIDLFTIATGYLLIDGGRPSAVARVTQTEPLSPLDLEKILNCAMAAQYMGAKALYLEAGSGAINPVSAQIIQCIKSHIDLPLIVGGGLRQKEQMKNAWTAGADMIVVGTAIEEVLSLTQ